MRGKHFHSAGRLLALALSLVLGGRALAAPGLQLEASPRQLLVGHDEVATLTLRGPPEQLHDVRLSCTAGSVRGLRRIGPQQLRAEYVPPRSGAATWVLCGAVAGGGGSAALLGLELQRREMLALSGLPSLSRVLVKMGDALYGPVRANAVGYVEVPVTLTPTVPRAEIQATPPGKPTETRQYPLSVSATEQVLLMAAGSEVVADGTRALPVWAFTLGDRGEPQEQPVAFGATEGALAMKRVGPGLWAGPFTPTGRTSPGEAALTARLLAGHTSSVRVELLQGLRPLLTLEGPEDELLADGATTVDLKVRVSDQDGRPMAAQPVRLLAERGRVGRLEERTPGLYVAQYTVPSGTPGPVQVSAELSGAAPAIFAIHLQAPPRLIVEVSPRQLPADGRSRALLFITARDPQGRELPEGTPVLVSTTLGTLPAQVPTSGGRARVELVASRAAGDAVIEVSALDASARTTVRFVPGAPARVLLRSDHPTLQCDGRDSTDLHLFVQDENDNGLDGVHIDMAIAGAASGQEGHFDRVAALGKGEFIVRYHAPEVCTPGLLAVEATAGGIRGETRLQLARSYPRLTGLTARVGGQDSLNGLYSSTVDLEGNISLGMLPDSLQASADLQLAFSTLTTPVVWNAGNPVAHYQLFILSLSLGPKWTFLDTGRLSAYVGVGLGGYLALVDERSTLSATDLVVPTPKLGPDARVGLGYRLGPGQLVLQARYGYARIDSPEFTHLQLAGLSASAGYRFTF